MALVGNPNVGKTTVFNLLTGLRQRVANFPGVTVERKSGRLAGAPDVEVIDLPGTYSLAPKSLDEQITYDVLVGRLERRPDVVVCVADASNLERNLFLVSQVMDLGLPVVVVLNMVDAADKEGKTVDAEALSAALGVPVVPMVALRGEGLHELKAHLVNLPSVPEGWRWPLMPVVEAQLPGLAAELGAAGADMPESQGRMEALRALTDEAALEPWTESAPAFVAAVRAARTHFEERSVAYRHAEVAGRYRWVGPLAHSVTKVRRDSDTASFSDRVDAFVTHRVWGPIAFVALLALVFQAVFSWAVPAMDLVEAGVGGLGGIVRAALPTGWVTDLLVEGVIAGVGNVVIFLPQILLLFFFLGLMEDTGYMARTAFIMDKLMKRVGLSGGSVLPLLSSFACAIPGIMAARTLDNERDRIITIMVAPLMSCSARLPVYTLFIAAFIPAGKLFGLVGYQGLAMFSMYLMGTVMAVVAAWVLKRFVFKGSRGYFVMELPPYRRPRLRQVLQRMIKRSQIFAVRAGKIIFACSVVLWFLASYPATTPGDEEPGFAVSTDVSGADSLALGASMQIRGSFIGMMGRTLEPLMAPLGFDWKMSAGIVTAFAAREVIISTLGIIYSVGEDADETSLALRDQLKTDTYPDGQPVFTTLSALSLLVFFVFALQCMSTLAIARRETGTWLWPAVMWCYMTGLAYLASLVVYQGGRLLGFA